ncbi:uncharacterized protein LOC110435683 [Sorghum bicolor]|uniref:uncharacterized protein LOC110435683 n=1 Tax=Sorghum bicolor TaxID=4558 RepID=UPI000B4262C6|nr:uncharacterized protein LOC110435683 [Sorghum bicolor]|eukprot:XP_021317250.1 uncharacterized protein LOC110435683 [Sorghum bicolor]
MDNREWMYTGHSSQGQVTNEWINKTDDFLERAFGEASKGASKIFCPCSKCANRKRQTKEVMGQHLWKNGFTPDYTRWVYHGEADRMREEVVRQRVEDYDADAGVADILDDTAATPSLSQIRARSMSASLAIRPRPYTTQHRMEALQAQLEEEKRRREELEARIVAKREAEQRRFAEILQYMQSLGAA